MYCGKYYWDIRSNNAWIQISGIQNLNKKCESIANNALMSYKNGDIKDQNKSIPQHHNLSKERTELSYIYRF